MCHGWRRTRGSPLFSVCTHNKIDDFWSGEGRGAGGRPGAADPYISLSLAGGAVAALWSMTSPAHTSRHGGRWRETRRREGGRERRRAFALLQGWGAVLARSGLGPYVGPGLGMLLCTYPYPRNQKRVLLSPCWFSDLTPERVMVLHHQQALPRVGSRPAAPLHLELSPGQKERTSPRKH